MNDSIHKLFIYIGLLPGVHLESWIKTVLAVYPSEAPEAIQFRLHLPFRCVCLHNIGIIKTHRGSNTMDYALDKIFLCRLIERVKDINLTGSNDQYTSKLHNASTLQGDLVI